MSSTSVRSTAKKAPNQQRVIEREITIEYKSADEILTILAENHAVEILTFNKGWNEITSPVISAIFRLKYLRSLNLVYNQIGAEGAREIANHLDSSNLTSVNLRGNQIGDRGAHEIFKNIAGSKLCCLDLRLNKICNTETRQQFTDIWNELGNDPKKLKV